MKNLLIYLNPRKDFDAENRAYFEIQIDNSLKYWKKEDIIIATNFQKVYHGIKALEVPDELLCDFDTKACKINVIIYLLENKILNEETWYHDLEAFQGSAFNLTLEKDLAVTDYGWKPKWNTGVFFFTPAALDIFHWLKEAVYEHRANEEPVLWNMHKENFNNLNSRCQTLNITYNLGKRHVEQNLKIADKPIKVFHFHPYRENLLSKFQPLIPEKLAKLIYEKAPTNH